MKKIILFLALIIPIFIYGCTTPCSSKLFTKEGKCCTYVCNKECPSGYKAGTCNCECSIQKINETPKDANVDNVFDDNADITPPGLPT